MAMPNVTLPDDVDLQTVAARPGKSLAGYKQSFRKIVEGGLMSYLMDLTALAK
jgi:hypothetical protein